MSQYQALITDLDATAVILSSDGSDATDASRQAIKKAYAAGKHVACATGRDWQLAKPVVRALGLQGPCIFDGGTRIFDVTKEEVLWEKAMSLEALTAVFSVFGQKSPGVGTLITHNLRTPLKDVSGVAEDDRFIYLLGLTEDVAASICNAVNNKIEAVAHMTPSWEGAELFDVHVTHPEATKQHAIAVWQEMVGVTKAQTVGMGDGGNDIPLFEGVGLRVAVGNAVPMLKAVADYIAPDQSEEALAHVISKFLL